MSERAECDVRGEQRSAARQLRQQKHTQSRTRTQTQAPLHTHAQQQPPPPLQPRGQQGEASTAMATAGERRSLPSPQIMLGQPWSNWVDAAKLHGNDGAEPEESLKECGGWNREAMRLCRDDMGIFGQCPARDDFFLVMCSHCGQVVKPQAFQAHYERRHGSISKPPTVAVTSTIVAYLAPGLSRPGEVTGPPGPGRSATVNSTSPNSRILKPAKDKTPMHRRPLFPFKVLPDKGPAPAAKAEKVDMTVKVSHTTVPSATASPPAKPSLNCSSVPKPPTLAAPGQLVNGKGLSLDKKQDSSSSHKKQLHKRLPEREFNPDIHCGVLDLVVRKPCTRSLTCKTHSLSQRRAVPGRRKRFDTLLAEHKSKARHRELQRGSEQPQQPTSLRDPHPTPSRLAQDHHPAPHGNGTVDAKASAPSRPKPHNPSLPRLNSGSSHPGGSTPGDPAALAHGSPHHSTSTTDGVSRLSSDEGENEEREESVEKLDFHYSGHHPRPAAFCTFGSRQPGRGCYTFDRRWDHIRCALSTMVDKHVNSHLWKKIPPAPDNLLPTLPHRTSTNCVPAPVGFQCPTSSLSSPLYAQSFEGKPVLSYGTTLNARACPASSAEHPAYSAPSRQVSSSPQMPSGLSAVPGRPPKSKPSSKSFKFKEPSGGSTGGSPNSGGGAVSSAKKRKNSCPLPSQPPYPAEASPSPSFRKNCALNSGGSGSAHHPSLGYSSSHAGVHGLGFNCTPGRTNSLSLKQDQSGRGPPSGSPAESIKRMSVVMNSSDSTLSLGPFVHQGGAEQAANSHGVTDGRPESRKRKGPPTAGGLHSGGGSPGPGRPKVSKSLAVNNIHGKHGRSIPGTQGLPNNSLLQQPKARP